MRRLAPGDPVLVLVRVLACVRIETCSLRSCSHITIQLGFLKAIGILLLQGLGMGWGRVG